MFLCRQTDAGRPRRIKAKALLEVAQHVAHQLIGEVRRRDVVTAVCDRHFDGCNPLHSRIGKGGRIFA